MTRISHNFLVLSCFSIPVLSMLGDREFSNFGKNEKTVGGFHDHEFFDDHVGEEHGDHTSCWVAAWRILLATQDDATFKSIVKGCLAEETGVHMDWTPEERKKAFWTKSSQGVFFPEWFISAVDSADGFTNEKMKEVAYENMFEHMFGHGVGDAWNITDIIDTPENLKEFILYKGLANFVGHSQHSKWMLAFLHAKVTDKEITDNEYDRLAYEFMARNFGNGPMDFFMTRKLFEKAQNADPTKATRDAWIYQYFFRQNRKSFEDIVTGRTKLESIKLIPAADKFAKNFEWVPHGVTAVPFLSGKAAKNVLSRPTVIPGDRSHSMDFGGMVDYVVENYLPEETSESLPDFEKDSTYMFLGPVIQSGDVFSASRALEDLMNNMWGTEFPTSDAPGSYTGSLFGYCHDVPKEAKQICQEYHHDGFNFGTANDEARGECEAVGCCWEPTSDMSVPFCFQTDVRATCGYNSLSMYDVPGPGEFSAHFYNLYSWIQMTSRLECGHPGITENQCLEKNCCWDTTMIGTKLDGPSHGSTINDFSSLASFIGVDTIPGNNVHDPHHGEGKSPWCYSKVIRWEVGYEDSKNENINNLFGGLVPEENACHLSDHMKQPCIEGSKINEFMNKEACENMGCCYEQDPNKHWEKYSFSSDGDNFIPRCYKSYNILYEEIETTTNV